MLTEMLYQCMPLGELHTHIWAYMTLGIPTLPGSPTKYSMDTYSILQEVYVQGLRCVTYTLWLREFLISQMWHFFRLSPKLVQKHFGNIFETIIHDSGKAQVLQINELGMNRSIWH